MYDPNEPRVKTGPRAGEWTSGDATTAIQIAASDKKLLAPNGKKSNLNEEDHKTVRTDEFKRWFGDWENDPKNASKMIDENGEPMLMYHGTKQIFEQFDRSAIGTNLPDYAIGFHFSSEKTVPRDIYARGGGTVKSVFLDIRNPLKMQAETNQSSENFIDENRYDIAHKVIDSRKTKSPYDGVIVTGWENHKNAVVFEPNQIKIVRHKL